MRQQVVVREWVLAAVAREWDALPFLLARCHCTILWQWCCTILWQWCCPISHLMLCCVVLRAMQEVIRAVQEAAAS